MNNEETKKLLENEELLREYAEYKALYIQHMGGIMTYDEKKFNKWFAEEILKTQQTPSAEELAEAEEIQDIEIEESEMQEIIEMLED